MSEKQSGYDLRQAVKQAQERITYHTIGYSHNTFIALDLDSCNLVLFANSEAYTDAVKGDDLSPFLLSRFYEDAWHDREQFLVWGQQWIDKHYKENK
jgi:hypothetical protein